MPQNVQPVLAVQGDHGKIAVFIDGSREIVQLPIEFDRNSRLGQSGTDRLGHLQTGHATRMGDDGSVRILKIYWHCLTR